MFLLYSWSSRRESFYIVFSNGMLLLYTLYVRVVQLELSKGTVSIGGNTAAAAATAATAAIAATAKGRVNGSNEANGANGANGNVVHGKVKVNLFKRSSDLRSTAKAASQRGARHRIFFHNRLNHLQDILGATIQEAEEEEEETGMKETGMKETGMKGEAGAGAAEGARGVTVAVAEENGDDDYREYVKEVAAVAVCMGVGAVEMRRWEAEYEYLIKIEGLQVRGTRNEEKREGGCLFCRGCVFVCVCVLYACVVGVCVCRRVLCSVCVV